MSAEVRLEEWSICISTKTPYAPPDGRVFVLKGKVYGHPTHRDGSRVTTSVIQRSIGRIVVCAGRRYLLGVVDAEYFRWLRANGHTLDHDNPVKINV